MKREYIFTFIIVAIYAFANRLLSFFLPLHFKEIGFSGMEIGLFYSAFALAGLVSAFHSGLLNDRIDSRKMILLGLLLVVAYLVGLSLSQTFIGVIIFMFMGGLGNRIFSLSTDSYILKKVKERKGFNFGLYDAFKSLAAAIAIFIGGRLLFNFEMSFLLAVSGGIIFLSIPLLLKMPKTHIKFQKLNLYISDIKNRRSIIFLILVFIFTLHWGVESTLYALFLENNLGLNIMQMGVFMSFPVALLATTAVYLGTRVDKAMSFKELMFIAFILSGFGLTMMALFSNVYISFIFRLIHEMGDGAFVVFMFMGASSYFPKERMGGNYGSVMLVTIISWMISTLIFSPVGEVYGYHIPHIIVGTLIFFAGFMVFLFKK